MTSSFDVEIRNAISPYLQAGVLCLRPSQSQVFLRELGIHFPVRGSRIAWADTREWTHSQDLADHDAAGFIDAVSRRFSLSGSAIYVADGPFDDAITGELRDLGKVLPYLLSFPQHHYIIGPAYGWAICCSFEGNLDFGFAPWPSGLAS